VEKGLCEDVSLAVDILNVKGWTSKFKVVTKNPLDFRWKALKHRVFSYLVCSSLIQNL